MEFGCYFDDRVKLFTITGGAVMIDNKMMIREEYDPLRYVWGNKKVNAIRKVIISWGDLPIYHIKVENDTVSLYRKINFSRDGWMRFPEGYFDEKKKLLDAENKRKLFKYLDSIDFTKWTTDETTIVNIEIGAYGFCVNESFSCVFEDDTTFYCATPPRRQFKKMVKFFKKFFVGENYSKWHS